MAPHDTGRQSYNMKISGGKKDVKHNIQPKQETTGLCWPTLLTFPLTFRIVAATVASTGGRRPSTGAAVLSLLVETQRISRHITRLLFLDPKNSELHGAFSFFLCAWDTWHLAAGSLACQMSVIDILGMRLDFMIWLFKKEMSSVTENGINGGEKMRQSNKNQPPNASAGWTPPMSCAMTYLAMPFVTSASPGLEQN